MRQSLVRSGSRAGISSVSVSLSHSGENPPSLTRTLLPRDSFSYTCSFHFLGETKAWSAEKKSRALFSLAPLIFHGCMLLGARYIKTRKIRFESLAIFVGSGTSNSLSVFMVWDASRELSMSYLALLRLARI